MTDDWITSQEWMDWHDALFERLRQCDMLHVQQEIRDAMAISDLVRAQLNEDTEAADIAATNIVERIWWLTRHTGLVWSGPMIDDCKHYVLTRWRAVFESHLSLREFADAYIEAREAMR